MSFLTKIKATTWLFIGAALIGTLVFFSKYGLEVLDVQKVDWFLWRDSDRASDFSMWQFYRNTPFSFPFGKITGYAYPTETGIGACGGIALIAMPLKLLSPWLPLHFQFFGWWLLVCYVLQSVFAVRLLRLWGIENTFLLLLCVVFLSVSPVLLTRTDHINLNAHWLILGGLCTYFDTQKSLRSRYLWHLAWCVMGALIHPYWVLFNLALAAATLLDECFTKKNLHWGRALAGIGGLLGAIFSAWWLAGNFVMKTTAAAAGGFAKFSSNLNALFNSEGRTNVLPKLPYAFSEQYEGFGYLGAGIIFLLPAAIVFYFLEKNKKISRHKFLILVTFLLTLFAFSTVITFNQYELLNVGKGILIRPLADTFRSSGRYIWLLHYLVSFGVLWIIIKKLEQKKIILSVILTAAALLQCYDLYPMYRRVVENTPKYDSEINFDIWRNVTANAKRIVMCPPYSPRYKTSGDWVCFAELAYEQKIPVTAGYMPRHDIDLQNQYIKPLRAAFESGELPPNESESIFVSSLTESFSLQPLVAKKQLEVFQIDGYIVGIPPALAAASAYLKSLGADYQANIASENLAMFFARHKNHTVLMSVRDEGSAQLCEAAKKYLKERKFAIEQIPFRGSYIAVLHHDEFVAEKMDAKNNIAINFLKNDKIGNFVSKKNVSLFSGGADTPESVSKIVIDGKNYAPNERGFNIVVLDDDFRVLETTFFDTYLSCFHNIR